MKLYCVRHGEAFSSAEDSKRTLTIPGSQDVEKIARYLKLQGVGISQLMHSPRLRAKQTAQIFAEQLAIEKVTECESILNEEADVTHMLTMIQSWGEDTMLVGHLPFMYKLVSALAMGDANYYPIVNYPPATVVCLEYFEQQRWVIDWLLNPGIVSE